MILGWEKLKADLDKYCLCWMGGAFGTGKTLLSVAIASMYAKEGFDVFTNFQCSFRSNFRPSHLEKFEKSVIILDEGGARYYGSRSWMSKEQQKRLQVVNYSRKMGLRWLYPSKAQVDAQLRGITILSNEVAKLKLNLGNLVWFYRVFPSATDAYNIALLCPYAYFPEYDTKQIPGAYEDALGVLIQRFMDKYAYDPAAAERAADDIMKILESGQEYNPNSEKT